MLFSACSMTSHLPEGEVLYRGIDKLTINNPDEGEHADEAFAELYAALECPPNGAFMGSSTIKTPFPIGLWVWNGLLEHQTGPISKWMFNTFGTPPVLISTVNPTLRSKMALTSLHNFGYFNSSVKSEIVPTKNPKKAKVSYTVNMGKPHYLDSIAYVGFPDDMNHLIDSTKEKTYLRKGDPFCVIELDAERNRIANVMQNNGYFYYRPDYMTYKADTLLFPGKVQLHLEPIASAEIPQRARHQWRLGSITTNLRQNRYQQLTDSLAGRGRNGRRGMKVRYRGNKVPVRPRILARGLRMRQGDLYSIDKLRESQDNLAQLGIFSQLDFALTPRDTMPTCDILDLTIDATLDKPLSAELEVDMRTKSNGQIGPSLDFGISKKNVFRGGETFSVNMNGSYEWQTQKAPGESASKVNSYEVGLTATLDFPRIVFPGIKMSRSRYPRHTLFKLGVNELHRAGFFDLLSFTGEATYTWQNTPTKRYSYSPLRLTYSKLQSTTARFDSIMTANKSLFLSMNDQFIPAMSFTYTYDNTATVGRKSHIWWQTTVTESGNLLSGIYAIAGNKFNEQNKRFFNNPYAQFFKVTTDFRKTFQLSEGTQLATRVMAGLAYAYGNSSVIPYSEQFYVGGANSIRAYTVRAIGPGKYHKEGSSFMDQTGDFKFEANAEYRFNLTGSLNGAFFLDAGNVWLLRKDEQRPGAEFTLGGFLNQLALGTGLGLRYDMDFLVLRLDLGIALHNPYDTGKKGYYNIPKFKDNMSLHFAIGYPF